jgi:hypothetical protein
MKVNGLRGGLKKYWPSSVRALTLAIDSRHNVTTRNGLATESTIKEGDLP